MEEKVENIFEINGSEINIKDIERQIQDNIIYRKKLGAYSTDVEDIIKQPLLPPPGTLSQNRTDLSSHADSNWDIHAEYKISSHRPIIGRLLVWGRRLINNEVKRYVDILIGKQSEFNSHMVSILKDSNSRIDDIDNKINNSNSRIDDIGNKINNEIGSKRKDGAMKSNDIMNYFVFEDKYRGSIEEIKKKQSIYIEYFKDCKNVLDIGCGRGEFLTLLKENNTNGKGIDINEDMILYCQKNSLNVEKIDAISYLQSLKDKSMDGIFSSQVVEHLQLDELLTLIKLCYDKMQYGTYIVMETINPLCLTAHVTFYKDMSHVRLIPSDTLKFLLESTGFRNIDIKFLNMSQDERILDKFIIKNKNDENNKNIEIMNRNIDKLNLLLFGYQDYAIIAKK